MLANGFSSGLTAVLLLATAAGPWIAAEEAKLGASDPGPDDHFGHAVSVWGDTAIVGAFGDDHGDNVTDSGSAYVFVRTGTGWSEQAKLIAGDATAGDAFGYAVCLEGDTAVVGAFSKNWAGVTDAGSAYVFVRSGTTWTEQAKLVASDPGTQDDFGWSVSVSGDTALIGSRDDDHAGGLDAGSAYVFVRSGTTWTEQAKLTANDAAAVDFFGQSVSLSGDTAVVGAYYDDHSGSSDAGSAYVFVRSGTSWTQQAKLRASDPATGDRFGNAVSLWGDTVAVGAANESNAGGSSAGSAYVFVRSETSWTQQAKLTASNAVSLDHFGYSVGLEGDTLVAGAPYAGPAFDAGSAYVFARSGTTWTEEAELTASDTGNDDEYGHSVGLAGDAAVVGAWQDDAADAGESGSAYVFRLCPPPVTYCTAGTSASGCQAALSSSGSASAMASSGFELMATDVEGSKDGAFYFGTSGQQASPWGNGTSLQCVVPPLTRTGLMAGTGTTGQCDGSFTRDLNAYWCPTCPFPAKNPGAGAVVQAQLWYRDPLSTSNQTTSLSDAIEFCVSP